MNFSATALPLRRSTVLPALGCIATLALAGCNSGSHVQVEGMPTGPVSAATRAGVLVMPVVVDGHTGPPLLVDTGSPVTIINPAMFPESRVPGGAGTVPTLAFGGVTLRSPPVIGSAVFDATSGLAGILGGDQLCQFATTFNYRDGTIELDAVAPVADLAAEDVSVPFALEGGGAGRLGSQVVRFPATRVSLDVTIEGVVHPLVLDTGASLTTLRGSVFTALSGDGRGRLQNTFGGVGGASAGATMRARIISLAAVQVTDTQVATTGDQLLDAIATEVHHPVDGLLGVSFLREFLVTLDYPNRTVRLRRYATRDHVADEYRRVGFTLGERAPTAEQRYFVTTVYPGSDADSQGVYVGQPLVSVDGQATDALDLEAVDRLLRGDVGAHHVVTFSNRTQVLRVDELLPLP